MAERDDFSRTRDAARLDQDIRRLAAMRARIHAQRAPERAGNAAEKLHPGYALIGKCACKLLVGNRGSRTHAKSVEKRDFTKTLAAQPYRNACNATVTDDEIGAKTNHGDGDLARQRFQKIRKVSFISRREQHLRRTADTKPCERRQRLVGRKASAQRRHFGAKFGGDVGKAHAFSAFGNAASSPGRLAAHCVMLPAPRHTT